MEIKFNPDLDLTVELTFDSPHVVFYDAWYKKPGASNFTKFASGKDQGEVDESGHKFLLKNLSQNTQLIFELIFAGNGNTAYKASISLFQQGNILKNIPKITGVTNNKGVDSESINFKLVI